MLCRRILIYIYKIFLDEKKNLNQRTAAFVYTLLTVHWRDVFLKLYTKNNLLFISNSVNSNLNLGLFPHTQVWPYGCIRINQIESARCKITFQNIFFYLLLFVYQTGFQIHFVFGTLIEKKFLQICCQRRIKCTKFRLK